MKRPPLAGGFALLVLCSIAAAADEKPNMFSRFEARLLTQASVQKELKATPEQVTRIRDRIAGERDFFNPGGKIGQARTIAEVDEFWAKIVSETLMPEQAARLQQIARQTLGGAVLERPGVAEEMALTADQRAKVKQTLLDSWAAIEKIRSGKDKEPAKLQKIDAVRRKAASDSLNVLTAEQKDKWKESLGAPFKGKVSLEEVHGR